MNIADIDISDKVCSVVFYKQQTRSKLITKGRKQVISNK